MEEWRKQNCGGGGVTLCGGVKKKLKKFHTNITNNKSINYWSTAAIY